jgi:protein ImuA
MSGPANPRLGALRARIQVLEQGGHPRRAMPLGLPVVDAALPGGGLALGALHEIMGAGADEEDGAVPAAFAAALLARLTRHSAGKVLWCLAADDLYAPGLATSGLPPSLLVVARCRDDGDIVWAMEEGLRSAALAAVLGEIGALPPTAGRRLQLACETGGVTAFALRRWREGGLAARQRAMPSAAATRWRVAAAPSRATGESLAGPQVPLGVGVPCWRVELLRCRGGAPAAWMMTEGLAEAERMEESDATGDVAVAAGLADRPAAPAPRRLRAV